MSEYRWYVSKIWVGVEFQLLDPTMSTITYHQRELVGVIRRSGWVQQTGHFCHVNVPYMGKKRYAANAEARIFPFHSLTLEVGELPKKLELVWLGWCTDQSTPAFVDKRGLALGITDAGVNRPNTQLIKSKLWQKEWEDRSYMQKMWESQGMLRVEEEADKLARKVKIRRMKDEANEKRWAKEKLNEQGGSN